MQLIAPNRKRAKPVAPVLATALLLAIGAVLFAQADFRVESTLVLLQVTVQDHRGGFVDGLPQSSFHVFEDGIPQTVTVFGHEDVPVAVGLVIDNSGSMRLKLPEVVAASDAFARSSNPQDQMFVVNFNEHVSLGLPADVPFVNSPDALRAAMLRIQARGQTALYDAIARAFEHIRRSSLQKKVLIVVSDGGDNASALRLDSIRDTIMQSDVMVYTVGIFDPDDPDRNPGVLKQLARLSGGQAFFPEKVPDVVNVLETVSRDIRHQYTLGYTPSNASRDGTFRRIAVKLTGPHASHWIARTRTGYVAAPAAPAAPNGPAPEAP